MAETSTLNPNNITDSSKDEVDHITSRFVPQFKKPTAIPLTQTKKGIFGDIDPPPPPPKILSTPVKCSLSTLEKLNLFHFSTLRKKSAPVLSLTPKEKPKFVKSASIARIFGNNYSTKKDDNSVIPIATHKITERFQKTMPHEESCSSGGCEKNEFQIKDISELPDRDISSKALRTLSRGLGRLLRRRSSSIDISEPDPEYKVAYLGNVLTGWAKGDGCVEKPLATLWRNYTQNSKPDVVMKVRVCPSGLKATTKQHGLTEYWSHRITYCSAPKSYPRVFCWVYRHEGRKLKHEMRCHAIICTKDSIAKQIANQLQDNIARALNEFKRDKLSRQNARLSLANAVYDNPSMPRRKIMLSVGGNNYRPPLERSKSAPKLGAIEEIVDEENEEPEEEEEKFKSQETRQCCKDDYLFPAMTLGRRRCRRGHSIRSKSARRPNTRQCKHEEDKNTPHVSSLIRNGSEEDFVKILMHNNYNSSEPLEGEIMSYFDLKLRPKTKSLVNLHETDKSEAVVSSLIEMRRNSQSLDDLDAFTDEDGGEAIDRVFFNQNDILDILRSSNQNDDNDNDPNYTGQSLQLFLNLQYDSDLVSNGLEPEKLYNKQLTHSDNEDSKGPSSLISVENHKLMHLDSDEGSISSGCETASTITNNNEEQRQTAQNMLEQEKNVRTIMHQPTVADRKTNTMRKRVEFHRNVMTFQGHRNYCSTSNTVPVQLSNSNDSDDSEFSDESGYVEGQESVNRSCNQKS